MESQNWMLIAEELLMRDEVHAFYLEDLQVLSLNVAQVATGREHNIEWRASFETGLNEYGTHIVIGTLSAQFEKGMGECSVGGQFSVKGEDTLTSSELSDMIGRSSALETLYDFARVALGSSLAMVNVRDDLPRKSPTPQVAPFFSATGEALEI